MSRRRGEISRSQILDLLEREAEADVDGDWSDSGEGIEGGALLGGGGGCHACGCDGMCGGFKGEQAYRRDVVLPRVNQAVGLTKKEQNKLAATFMKTERKARAEKDGEKGEEFEERYAMQSASAKRQASRTKSINAFLRRQGASKEDIALNMRILQRVRRKKRLNEKPTQEEWDVYTMYVLDRESQ